jgi:hypothetical protein
MPLPDFMRSGERIESWQLRDSPPNARDHILWNLPPTRHGDAEGEAPMRGGLSIGRAELQGRTLDLICEEQKGDNWCWAAVAASLARFYDPQARWEQCELANRYLATGVCCGPDADMEFCDKPQRLDKVLQITGNLVSFTLGSEAPTSFEAIQSEIDNGRVVCSRVELFGIGGHFQMITGWKTAGDERYLIISDPLYSETEITFSSFASRYEGSGVWNVAYFTAPVMTDAPPVGIFGAPGTPDDLRVASADGPRSDAFAMVSARRLAATGVERLAGRDEAAVLFGG